jgi:hypothetical protein
VKVAEALRFLGARMKLAESRRASRLAGTHAEIIFGGQLRSNEIERVNQMQTSVVQLDLLEFADRGLVATLRVRLKRTDFD